MRKLKRVWCKLFHTEAMWPIHGRYLCATCLEPWEVIAENDVAKASTLRAPGLCRFWSGL